MPETDVPAGFVASVIRQYGLADIQRMLRMQDIYFGQLRRDHIAKMFFAHNLKTRQKYSLQQNLRKAATLPPNTSKL